MHLQTGYRFCATLSRLQFHGCSFYRVVFPGPGSHHDNVLDLRMTTEYSIRSSMNHAYLFHQQLCASVQPSCDGIVQGVLEALLLPYDAIQKIGPVDVNSLKQKLNLSASIEANEDAYEFLIKEHLHHRLDSVGDVD